MGVSQTATMTLVDPATHTLTHDLPSKIVIPVSNIIPPAADQSSANGYVVYDASNTPFTLDDLRAKSGCKNHLIIFIRHFFCGLCQNYLSALSEHLPPSSLPPSTTISIIGPGAVEYIPHYLSHTTCAYPLYADPSHKLYDIFHMNRNLSLGKGRPAYQTSSMGSMVAAGIWQGLTAGTCMFKAGPQTLLGGEVLFVGDKVKWCHRMQNTRDHTEVEELRKVLEREAAP